MSDETSKNYCTIDHSNKLRELARQTPYQFWLDQVRRMTRAGGAADENSVHPMGGRTQP